MIPASTRAAQTAQRYYTVKEALKPFLEKGLATVSRAASKEVLRIKNELRAAKWDLNLVCPPRHILDLMQEFEHGALTRASLKRAFYERLTRHRKGRKLTLTQTFVTIDTLARERFIRETVEATREGYSVFALQLSEVIGDFRGINFVGSPFDKTSFVSVVSHFGAVQHWRIKSTPHFSLNGRYYYNWLVDPIGIKEHDFKTIKPAQSGEVVRRLAKTRSKKSVARPLPRPR